MIKSEKMKAISLLADMSNAPFCNLTPLNLGFLKIGEKVRKDTAVCTMTAYVYEM